MKNSLLLFFFFLQVTLSIAQISPPGIDGSKLVSWGAIAFNQKLSKKWSITVYVGGARQSNPNNAKLFGKPAIAVLNQESLYSFTAHWQLAFCTSFRVQDIYSKDEPYELSHPGRRNELRYYLRMYYKHAYKRFSLAYNFRPEIRTFYTSSWEPWHTPLQLRFRLKGQVTYSLNESKSNQLIVANEILTVTDRMESGAPHAWSPYHFTEDRFSNFFRHTFSKPSVIMDLGVMHQFWKGKTDNRLHYTGYLSVDFIFQNLFGKLIG